MFHPPRVICSFRPCAEADTERGGARRAFVGLAQREFLLGQIWRRLCSASSIRMRCIVAALATGSLRPLAAADAGRLRCSRRPEDRGHQSFVLDGRAGRGRPAASTAGCWATSDPAINFEIRLPTTTWNGKFYMAGCGAQCGKVEPTGRASPTPSNHGLRRNYAARDHGRRPLGREHLGSPAGPRSTDPIARFDFEQRAVTETARVSKEVIAAYYGRAPEKSYFAGCSNGGRQAQHGGLEVSRGLRRHHQRLPVALRWRRPSAAWAWNVKANIGPDGESVLAFAKLPMIAKAVYDACAGEDGLIEDPGQCQFEPSEPGSAQARRPGLPDRRRGRDRSRNGTRGPRTASGEQIYPGLPLGSEPYWSCWLALEDEESWRDDKARPRR